MYTAYCLSSNTLITMADGSLKYICDVRPGERILAWDTDREVLTEDVVTASDAVLHKVADCYEIYQFDDGSEVEVVHAHRLYNVEDKKLKMMHEWAIGEHGLNQKGEEVALVNHIHVDKPIGYNTIMSKWSNYYANGLLTGNKEARYPFFKSAVANAN